MSFRAWTAGAVLVVLTGCGARKESRQEPARWIRVAHPVVADGPEAFPLTGTVAPRGAAQSLAFQVAGRVVRVGPREGQVVGKGQQLAVLDATAYAAGLEAAAAQTRSAQAAAARARDELRRMRIIYDRQSLPENDFRKFELAERMATEQCVQAQANEKVARKAVSDTRLTALVGGVVTRRAVEPGVTVAAGQPAFEIAQMDPVEIQIGIPENLVAAMRVGQRSKVTVPALPGLEFEGVLRVVNASADPASRTYMGRVAVSNPKGALRLGMVAETRIRGDRDEPMILVPYDAVIKDPQGAAMVFEFRPGDSRVLARRVVVGGLEGKMIRIRSGIDPAAQIVVAGQHFLRDGAPVRVETPNAPPLSGKN